jgi:metal-responsive CopG/Arc/MetJ family transcriptional regulator
MWRTFMAKKVIQVPVDEMLLYELDKLSGKQSKSRSEIIRQACHNYLEQMETEELDKIYQQGYERNPEEVETGEAQVTIVDEILPKEKW